MFRFFGGISEKYFRLINGYPYLNACAYLRSSMVRRLFCCRYSLVE